MPPLLSIGVKISGLDLFPGKPETEQAIGRSLNRSARAVVVHAERNLSGRYVRMHTGKLRRGMRSKVTIRDGRFVAAIRNIVFYGAILEKGAAPHRIKPKGGKFLRFEIEGKTILARGVSHPGIRPRRWFDSAVREAVPELQKAFEQEFGALTRQTRIVVG